MTKRWRSGSTFGPGPRAPLDREARAQFKSKLTFQRRPGRLTIATADVGRILVDMLGHDGRLDPSIKTIAVRARVSISTAKRALAQLKQYGFLTWTRRLVRDSGSGWRTEQASNAYVLSVPATEVQIEPAVQKVESFKCGHLSDRENAARQLVALGAPIPSHWGVS